MRRIALGFLLLTAGPAAAQPELTAALPPPPLTVSLDLETAWRLDPGYRLFSSSRAATRGGLSASYDLLRGPAMRLALAAGYHAESSSASWGNGQASLDVPSGSLGAVARWPLGRWLEPQLRLEADLSRAHLRLASLTDDAWSLGGTVAAGLRLHGAPTHLGNAVFALAGAVEAGFHLGQPLSFAGRREGTGEDSIPSPPAALGNLGRSYPTLRLSAAILF
jgi:hypothetical protein